MVMVFTQNPTELLFNIRTGINRGEVRTWSVSSKGYFTSSSDIWRNHAWFKPTTNEKRIVFNIIRPKGRHVSTEVYAVYHGRFSEMLLAHFESQLTVIRLTALAVEGDIV